MTVQPTVPLTAFELGHIRYEMRFSNVSTGLGGSPPSCSPAGLDVVQLIYIVRNDYDTAWSGAAVPRLVLVDPDGNVVRPDPQFTHTVTMKTAPPMTYRNGRLGAHETRLLADVFLTPAGDVLSRTYQLRIDSSGEQSRPLPRPNLIYTPECPQTPRIVAPTNLDR